MTTQTRKRTAQPSSCPPGYVPAGHIVPLSLTVRQQTYCRRAVGISKFVYNLCVATHQFCRTNRLPWPSWPELNQEFNAIKHDQFPFVTVVSKHVAEGAIRDFGDAIANWRDPALKARRPAFKKKRRTGTGSFRAASGVSTIHYNGKRRIRLPYLGSVKLKHTLPKGVIYEAHIRFKNGQWLLSINYWKPPQVKPEPDTRIEHGAVDTGINPHGTDSDGQTWENPRAYYTAEQRRRRWQRAQARRKVNSRGWWEAQRRIDVLHRRTANIRKNAQHVMTSQLVAKYRNLVIEDLNVAGMMAGRTPKAQADASMGELKRQLVYKGQWHQCQITLADRFYPSSKTCSKCQYVNAKLKHERYWQCPSCDTPHERNENAAANLRELLARPGHTGSAMPCDGKALAAGPTSSKTSPNDQGTVTPKPTVSAPLTVGE